MIKSVDFQKKLAQRPTMSKRVWTGTTAKWPNASTTAFKRKISPTRGGLSKKNACAGSMTHLCHGCHPSAASWRVSAMPSDQVQFFDVSSRLNPTTCSAFAGIVTWAYQVQQHPNPLIGADLFYGCDKLGKSKASEHREVRISTPM